MNNKWLKKQLAKFGFVPASALLAAIPTAPEQLDKTAHGAGQEKAKAATLTARANTMLVTAGNLNPEADRKLDAVDLIRTATGE